MQGKANFFDDNDDIHFHLEKRTDLAPVFAWLTQEERDVVGVTTAEEYAKTWADILTTVGEFSGTQLVGNAAQVEREHPKLLPNGDVELPPAVKSNVAKFLELGGSSMGVAAKYGGLSGPIHIELIALEILYRGCPSTVLNVCWYGSVANIIEKFGSEELKSEWIPKIASGEVSGSMSLTEPDNGSDLGGMKTYGTNQGDGTWRVFGNKQFISNGCGELSLVLAKNGKGAEGLKSLNLFLVPRKVNGKNNYSVTKVEEKPGLHGSATCALEFKDSVGYLLGKEGEGFMYMLHLMNEARIAVAFQGIGLMEASLRNARDYAEQRKSWGKPISKHELIAEKLLDMEVEIKAVRSLCMQSAYYLSLINAGERKLKEGTLSADEAESVKRKLSRYNKRLREWTPLVKWYSAERSVVHARNCVQIHGGYGFTTEYKAEWFLRESLILSIYEGTSQIQGLMCLKDTMKDIIRNPREFVETALGMKVKALSETDPLRRKVYKMRETFNSAVITILFKLVKENVRANLSATDSKDVMKLIKMLSKDLIKFENLSPALLQAERLCEMKAIVAMARCLVWDAKADPSRTWIAEYFIERNMPLLMMRKAEVESDDRILMEHIGNAPKEAKAARA